MSTYEEHKFNIPKLKGISAKNIEEHLKLYAGYVKNTNLISDKLDELRQDQEKNAFVMGELQRRFSFEFNGMRNHEYYFRSLEGAPVDLAADSPLGQAIKEQFGSFDSWLAAFKTVALTRGVGWAMLYYDPMVKRLVHAWVDEQHLGQLNGCPLILGLDMWEHSFVFDYQPSGKKQYIEDFFANLNWGAVEENYKNANK